MPRDGLEQAPSDALDAPLLLREVPLGSLLKALRLLRHLGVDRRGATCRQRSTPSCRHSGATRQEQQQRREASSGHVRYDTVAPAERQ